MSLTTIVCDSFDRTFKLYRDFIDEVEPGVLSSKLPQLPSNTVGEQLWCVVGARESYTRAIEAGQWSGFSCSLTTATDQQAIADALHHSAEALKRVLDKAEELGDEQYRLLINLLEHEAAHQGQLIRYFYGLKVPIPESWKSRYALV